LTIAAGIVILATFSESLKISLIVTIVNSYRSTVAAASTAADITAANATSSNEWPSSLEMANFID
jgi:hypothetical protein